MSLENSLATRDTSCLTVAHFSGIEKDWYVLDPKFPVRLLQTSARVYLPFILRLLEEYSRRGLTDKTDRVAAIDGLQTRIAAELDCRGQYAVFEEDFHRYLL